MLGSSAKDDSRCIGQNLIAHDAIHLRLLSELAPNIYDELMPYHACVVKRMVLLRDFSNDVLNAMMSLCHWNSSFRTEHLCLMAISGIMSGPLSISPLSIYALRMRSTSII